DPAVAVPESAPQGSSEDGSAREGRTAGRLRVLRLLAFVVVPGLFVAVLAVGLMTTTAPRAAVGEQGPEFALPLLATPGTLTSAELRGSPVVVNVWASWCGPCREEAPVLEAAWRRYRGRGVRFLGVNVQDSQEDAQAFVREFGITFPSVRDTDLDLWRKLGVRGVPETFFLDHRWRFSGIGSGERLGTSGGGTRILGAIRPAVLESQIRLLLDAREPDAKEQDGR
ncbi:MAG: TlpA family protein disulfide reductase, partial [Actinomycetota bacterium]